MISHRSRKMFSWLLQIMAAVAVYLGVQAWHQRDAATGMAPSLDGVSVAGESVSLAAHEGRPVVVHFWATWCGICKLEQGNIEALVDDYPVITVASRSGSPRQVADEVTARGLRATVVADPDGQLARRYGVKAFPTTFIIDAEGNIDSVTVGYTTELGLRARL